MRVLFVQQDHVSPPGPVGQAFAERGYDLEFLPVVPEEHFEAPNIPVEFPDVEAYDAIVPMGARWSVYDQEAIGAWVIDEIAFLRRAHDQGVPVLGICFGGQALAAALGGTVERAPAPEIGWTEVDSSRPDLVESGPWFQWHYDRWCLPPSVQAFARTDLAPQAFVVRRSMGVQFHPELTPTMLQGWYDHGGAEAARGAGLDPDAVMEQTELEASAAAKRAQLLVNRFLDQVASAPLQTPAAPD